jgi:tetratricopeptide (TPR) repeat protein
MADNPRIEDLRRRVQKDPASIAFAQLAEELRRSGSLHEAVDTSLAGLAIHPSYLSARVTLGRALLELDQLDRAQTELERVLAAAPENLAACRGLGEIFSRRKLPDQALLHYRAALALAPNDPDLDETVATLSRQVAAAEPFLAVAVAREPKVVDLAVVGAPHVSVDAVSCEAELADSAGDHARRTVVALEGWLDAIHVARAHRRA